MKVIFLDIDGVLKSSAWETYLEEKCGPPYFYICKLLEQRAILLLNTLIWETNAKVVLTSSWRLWEPQLNLVKQQLAPYKIELYGITPSNGNGRGYEIQMWLDAHPDVENFVILDDDDDMFHLMPYLVQTTWENGLQKEHIEKAITILKT